MALNDAQRAVFRELVAAGLISSTADPAVFEALFERFADLYPKPRPRVGVGELLNFPTAKQYVQVGENHNNRNEAWLQYDWIDIQVERDGSEEYAFDTIPTSLFHGGSVASTGGRDWDAAGQNGIILKSSVGLVVGQHSVTGRLMFGKHAVGIVTPERVQAFGRYDA